MSIIICGIVPSGVEPLSSVPKTGRIATTLRNYMIYKKNKKKEKRKTINIVFKGLNKLR